MSPTLPAERNKARRTGNAFLWGFLAGFVVAALLFVALVTRSATFCESTNSMCRIQTCHKLVILNGIPYCEEWKP